MEAGIRCVIAPSFGDIFHDNAFQNGVLPLHVEMPVIERIVATVERSNTSEMTVDLQQCKLIVPGLEPINFSLADDRRRPLLEGLDQLSFMLHGQDKIAAFEASDATTRPWAYPRQ
jgi:3-isopropylmalate/(R)-2-methylmalate dehydratase small subunit